MSTAAKPYIREDEANVVSLDFVRIHELKLRPTRVLYTHLTDGELEDRGLSVYARSGEKLWLSDASDDWCRPQFQPASSWLAVFSDANRGGQPQWLAELEQRLNSLRDISGEEALPFSEASRQAAIKFAVSLRRARRPSAFLLGNGNIRMLWINALNEQVGLQFREDGMVQFVLFKSRENQLVHTMGSDTTTGVLQTVAGLGLMHVIEP